MLEPPLPAPPADSRSNGHLPAAAARIESFEICDADSPLPLPSYQYSASQDRSSSRQWRWLRCCRCFAVSECSVIVALRHEWSKDSLHLGYLTEAGTPWFELFATSVWPACMPPVVLLRVRYGEAVASVLLLCAWLLYVGLAWQQLRTFLCYFTDWSMVLVVAYSVSMALTGRYACREQILYEASTRQPHELLRIPRIEVSLDGTPNTIGTASETTGGSTQRAASSVSALEFLPPTAQVSWFFFGPSLCFSIYSTITSWHSLRPKDPPASYVLSPVPQLLHALMTAVILLDAAVGRIPFRMFHAAYVTAFAFAFFVFSAIYKLASGGQGLPEGTPIEALFDYSSVHSGFEAVGWSLLAFFGLLLTHASLWLALLLWRTHGVPLTPCYRRPTERQATDHSSTTPQHRYQPQREETNGQRQSQEQTLPSKTFFESLPSVPPLPALLGLSRQRPTAQPEPAIVPPMAVSGSIELTRRARRQSRRERRGGRGTRGRRRGRKASRRQTGGTVRQSWPDRFTGASMIGELRSVSGLGEYDQISSIRSSGSGAARSGSGWLSREGSASFHSSIDIEGDGEEDGDYGGYGDIEETEDEGAQSA